MNYQTIGKQVIESVKEMVPNGSLRELLNDKIIQDEFKSLTFRHTDDGPILESVEFRFTRFEKIFIGLFHPDYSDLLMGIDTKGFFNKPNSERKIILHELVSSDV